MCRRFFSQPNGARPAPRQSTLSFSTRTGEAAKKEEKEDIKEEPKEEPKDEDVKPGLPSSGMFPLPTQTLEP